MIQPAEGTDEIEAVRVSGSEGVPPRESRGGTVWGVRTGDYGLPTIVELEIAGSLEEARPQFGRRVRNGRTPRSRLP